MVIDVGNRIYEILAVIRYGIQKTVNAVAAEIAETAESERSKDHSINVIELLEVIRKADININALKRLHDVEVFKARKIYSLELFIVLGKCTGFSFNVRKVGKLCKAVVNLCYGADDFLCEIRYLVVHCVRPVGISEFFRKLGKFINSVFYFGGEICNLLHDIIIVKGYCFLDNGENAGFTDTRFIVCCNEESLSRYHIKHLIFVLIRGYIIDYNTVFTDGECVSHV